LEKQASPEVIDCLLLHDKPHRPSLHLLNGKGETPILQAIKHGSSDPVVRLLVQYDTTRQTLLIPSQKRKKTPLFYVASQELDFQTSSHEQGCQISSELLFMLFHTSAALEMQRNGSKVDPNDDVARLCDHPSEDLIFRATLSCAHLLGVKSCTKLYRLLLPKISLDETDPAGNTLLHYVCRSTSDAQAQVVPYQGESKTMLQYLLLVYPRAAEMFNQAGQLPIHLALSTKKSRNFLEELLHRAPACIQRRTKSGQLPLHIALKNCVADGSDSFIFRLWQQYPDAALIFDPVERLFSFQLAASVHGIEEVNLTTSYFLLRSCPELLQQLCSHE